MSAGIITNIIATESTRNDLIQLIKRQHELDDSINSYKEDLKDIQINYKALGIKPHEFKSICKFLRQDVDLLHNEQETLDNILTLRDFMDK